MPESELNEVIAGLRRADAAIGALAEKVARLALQVKFALVKAAGVEAERAAESLRLQASSMAEVPIIKKSSSTNGWINDADKSEINAVDEYCNVSSDLAKIQPALTELKEASNRAENAFAARVLELHDRLGGFIKSNGGSKFDSA